MTDHEPKAKSAFSSILHDVNRRLFRRWYLFVALFIAIAVVTYLLIHASAGGAPLDLGDLSAALGIAAAATAYLIIGIGFASIWSSVVRRLRETDTRVDRAEIALGPSTATHPSAAAQPSEKVQPAWDLARGTLEQYWQRNLLQNNMIFGLSVAAVTAGFVVMTLGVRDASVPTSSPIQR